MYDGQEVQRKQDGIVKENEARPLPNGPLGTKVGTKARYLPVPPLFLFPCLLLGLSQVLI